MESKSVDFTFVDYCVLAVLMLVSIAINAYITAKGTKSSDQFLKGNKAFHPIPVAISLTITFISTISILG